jgi:hypothetical protein
MTPFVGTPHDPERTAVDVVVLTPDGRPPPQRVRSAIEAQTGRDLDLSLRLHVVAGTRRPGDPNRWATIARARNAAKRLGTASLVMFVDDDVILGRGCVVRLVKALRTRPGYAALGADYLDESPDWSHPDGIAPIGHVAMGATLFRREVLAFLDFRWAPGRCECRCCCDDLRRAGLGIGYLRGALARHEPRRGAGARHGARDESHAHDARPPRDASATAGAPRVLTAFDRWHLARFRRQFVPSFRAAGNDETIVAVTYGLYPSERRALEALPGVEVVVAPNDDDLVVPARRLRDFQGVVRGLPADTPVAYWDAGDVIFQSRVAPVWELVRAHPDRLLVVRDDAGHPENTAVANWTLSITDPQARRYAYNLLTTHTYFNGGFAAGTARTVLRYLRGAHQIRHSRAMTGSSNPGDQTAMNLYCHADASRWHEIAIGWNYCINHRDPRTVRLLGDGRFVAAEGTPIHVIHGNGRALRKSELSFLREGTKGADE